jgi:hypothetical protein
MTLGEAAVSSVSPGLDGEADEVSQDAGEREFSHKHPACCVKLIPCVKIIRAP